jgi:hypothetical protein
MSCDLHRTCHLLNNGTNPSCFQRGLVHCDLLCTGHLHSPDAMWVPPIEHGPRGGIDGDPTVAKTYATCGEGREADVSAVTNVSEAPETRSGERGVD